MAGTGRLPWGNGLGGREGRRPFWIWDYKWTWILDIGF